jgi:hypothetical protein
LPEDGEFVADDGGVGGLWGKVGAVAAMAMPRSAIDARADLLRSAGLIEVARLRVQPGPRGRFPDGYLLTRKTEVEI